MIGRLKFPYLIEKWNGIRESQSELSGVMFIEWHISDTTIFVILWLSVNKLIV